MASLIKKIGQSILCFLLEWQTKRLRQKNNFKIITILGSLGKTSTKLALAKTLELLDIRVRYQEGNYNVRLTVPLTIFGHESPSTLDVIAWIKILVKNEKIISKVFPYDYVVLELGTDGPGQIRKFGYLKTDLEIITAISPEHMENFGNLERVAKEELSLIGQCNKTLINTDDIAIEFLPDHKFVSYGTKERCDYRITQESTTEKGQKVIILKKQKTFIESDISYLGTQGMKIIVGVVAAADMLGISKKQIKTAIYDLQPFSGRMQRLHGKLDSIIIDDTYNASVESVLAALDVLNSIVSPQHIAILGSMNELGNHSEYSHRIVGGSLTPEKVDLVVTIGSDAEKYIASAAKANGCEVVSFDSPYKAGEFVSKHISPGAVILAKGSQNGVFAEEAVKLLLKSPEDQNKLVRQSKYWLKVKQRQFNI